MQREHLLGAQGDRLVRDRQGVAFQKAAAQPEEEADRDHGAHELPVQHLHLPPGPGREHLLLDYVGPVSRDGFELKEALLKHRSMIYSKYVTKWKVVDLINKLYRRIIFSTGILSVSVRIYNNFDGYCN